LNYFLIHFFPSEVFMAAYKLVVFKSLSSFQIINHCHIWKHEVSLNFVVGFCFGQNSFLNFMEHIATHNLLALHFCSTHALNLGRSCNFVSRKVLINLQDVFEQLWVHKITITFVFDVTQNCRAHLRHYAFEDNHSKLDEALVTQIGNSLHVDEKSIKILENSCKPAHHNLVVAPSLF
jgi:hypothetical protein